MGAIRAGIVTGLIYIIMTFANKKWLENVSPEYQSKVNLYLPMILIFIIETLL